MLHTELEHRRIPVYDTIRYERDLLESNTDPIAYEKSDITISTVTKPIQTSIRAEQILDDVSKILTNARNAVMMLLFVLPEVRATLPSPKDSVT